MTHDKMREALDQGWQAYCKAPTNRDMGRSKVEAAIIAALDWQAARAGGDGEALRYTSDGALAECPCCGSLDVGGAGGGCTPRGKGIVNCYSCGLTIEADGPMQAAIDLWNRRARPPAPAAKVPDESELFLHAESLSTALSMMLGAADTTPPVSPVTEAGFEIVKRYNAFKSAAPTPEKHTRSQLPEGVTRTRNAATGEIKAAPEGGE